MVESSRYTKCLMPDQRIKPVSANDCSTSDEASKLDLYLQKQLEEDVARIFDESIYSDLEVVCGKLKLLTHSCILKARTNKFYNKLEAILHVNIGREVFDEIYSFISDAYTECNIKNQEKEILIFLKGKLFTKGKLRNCNKTKEDIEDVDVFLTPNSTSPHIDNKYQPISCLSPSTDLTKEYYALVHIEGNLLEQELIEQDALSDAFHTIIKSQETVFNKTLLHNKPTSLSLVTTTTSHSSNTIQHSSNCDIYNKVPNEHATLNNSERKSNNNQFTKACKPLKGLENNLNNGASVDKVLDPAFSPDSLITDEPSSSSDYLSAACAYSPALATSSCCSQFNVGETGSKMENIFTSSDSGLENTAMLESTSSHKEITLTDTSLTETYNIPTDETCHLRASASSPETENINTQQAIGTRAPIASSSSNDISVPAIFNGQKHSSVDKESVTTHRKCSKEEKQRQNEEIVILESSSVSSETGSWESVFPPKLTDKEICDKFIHNERQYRAKNELMSENCNYTDYQKIERLMTKHGAPCFIDAANLADEELVSIPFENTNYCSNAKSKSDCIPTPSRPVPCAVVNKVDVSPGDWSESNDNDDSLEHGDNKYLDSMYKDLSPTIFEMTLHTEDFLTANIISEKKVSVVSSCDNDNIISLSSSTDCIDTTPHNSMISLTTSVKKNETEKNSDDIIITDGDIANFRMCHASTPIHFDRAPMDEARSPRQDALNSIPFIRETENVPIPGTSFSNEVVNSLPRTPKSVYTSAWVVDMADRPKLTDSDKFASNLSSKKLGDKTCENLKNERMTSSSDHCKSRSSINSDSSEKSGHKFFIDLSTLPDPLPPEKPIANNNDSEKKSMFSMYIDLGANSACKDLPPRLRSAFTNKGPNKNIMKHKTPKSSCNEKRNDICLPLRDPHKTYEPISSPEPETELQKEETNRTQNKHVNRPNLGSPPIKEDKTCSETRIMTVAKYDTLGTSSNVSSTKILPRPEESLNISSVTNRIYEVENKEETSSLSHNKGVKSISEYHELTRTFVKHESLCGYTDINISETIDIPGASSKSTDNEIYEVEKNGENVSLSHIKKVKTFSVAHDLNASFEEYESLCSDPNISISEIIAIPKTVFESANDICESKSNKIEKPFTRRVNGDKAIVPNEANVIHEESNDTDDRSADLFVKLSDLDRPSQKCDIFERERLDSRMTRSIPDNDWLGRNVQSISFKSSDVMSSFHSENALSLNRLFPHLKNEFSRSMPVSLSGRTRSPLRPGAPGAPSSVGELDETASEVSEVSGVPSSMCRSVIENSTTEETSQTSSLISNCQSRLGQDLLRMFLEEIAPDVIVEVPGKRIKAHKCILSSRCPYFAGILSGGWVESGGNVINLPPFSYNVVHFALCHIYSGVATIPDSISIVELATIADMLSLEGLKEAIMFTLKAKYCHHFHEPCQVCTVGVLECFPLSSVYGLDDLYRKCLRWITKHFAKVWPTKAFATLPKELLDKCYQEHVVNLSIENLFDTVYGCGMTVASLQNSRWAESVARMCRRLVNAAAHFAARRLVAVLQLLAAPGAPPAATAAAAAAAGQALEDCLAVAVEWAPPDEACRAYAYLSRLAGPDRGPGAPEPNPLLARAGGWRSQCERALVRAAPRVVGTQAFKDLPAELRKRLRELGCIMYGPQIIPPTAPADHDRRVRSAYHGRPNRAAPNPITARSLEMERVRNTFVPYKPAPVEPPGPRDRIASDTELRDFKKTSRALKVRMTRAQEERTKFNQTKSLTTQNSLATRPPARRPRPFENTKPRYLESRPAPRDGRRETSPKKSANRAISSGESSRNSSPNQSKITRNGRNLDKKKCERPDARAASRHSPAAASRPRTAEPSTDSLSESRPGNKYATYTKTKHTDKGSVESVMLKCHGLSPSSLPNANIKTKIPVYLNQNSSAETNGGRADRARARPTAPLARDSNCDKSKAKSCERKNSGFRNATKASSAKAVPRVARQSPPGAGERAGPGERCGPGERSGPDREGRRKRAMERSGTFLKDEPTFGDRTADIDGSH